MRLALGLVCCALATVACGPAEPAPTTLSPPTAPAAPTTATPPPATTPDLPATTATPPPPAGDAPCAEGATPFVTGGLAATLGEEAGDAAAIGGIAWSAHEGCERIVIDLLTTNGAPAGSLGEAAVTFLSDLGVVRVDLPVTVTGIADSLVEGAVAERVFVVRRDTGLLTVDIHLATPEPIMVRGFEVSDPVRVVVDLAASREGAGRDRQPVVSESVVLLSPPAGTAAYPLTVSGYARTLEGDVVAELMRDGAVAVSDFTTATDSTTAWGEFTIVLETGPAGEAELFVGEPGGAPGGVTLALVFS